MNVTLRQIAVSGGAAVALLGGATAITMAAPAPATAATQQIAEHAVTAPVQLPDGRTMRITGMGGYGHQATTAHVATVTAVAYKTGTGNGTSTGVTTPDPNSPFANLQNPINTPQTPATYNTQQISTMSANGTVVGVGVVAILALAIIVVFKVKHGHIKAFDAVLTGLLGISLAGTVIGSMGSQLTNSFVGSLGGMLSGLH